ncbi:Mitochondrial import inner membrane translocase subunit TIM50-C [Hypsibius exemplaris]|uniref:Mitochondrial import inner membrane translocase subunit TIM50 n=1 Tax=Hypsibius exemplaris TaxID=2072580 RepID=A0A1W0W9T0_HYPEX|nr:Mitochondrial import inner membrane translocase subunit TIM50-C [Hypsibius exemplaris]
MPPLLGKVLLSKISLGLTKNHPSICELPEWRSLTSRRATATTSALPLPSISVASHRIPVRNFRWTSSIASSQHFPCLFFSTSLPRRDANKAPTSNLLGKIESASVGSTATNAGAGGGGGYGGTSAEEEEEKRRKDAFSKKAMKWSLVAMGLSLFGAAGFCILEWGAPKLDENGSLIRDEFTDMPTWKQFILRAWKEIVFYEKMIKEPSREKLLPDPLQEPYHQPPYTVVLEMTGVLVHPDWTYGTGWRFKKRPGVDYFLEQLAGPYFEIVIYTNEQAFTAYPILLSLDPNGYVMYRLFRDSTRYVKGKHVKDLSYLNRDLSKTIVVEWDPEVVPGHTRNVVFLPKWQGNDDDRTLYELATFLKTIAASDVDDVRDVLDNYRNEDDILGAFKQRQQMLREEQTKAVAMQSHLQEEKDKRSLLSSLTPSIFGRR